jgi:hypothetical protein
MIYANPDFWDHLPADKSGAWNRFSQNNLKYMVKHKYGMELQLRESATITADHCQLLEFRSVAGSSIKHCCLFDDEVGTEEVSTIAFPI